eukprot:2918582-Rhodomonas_salina.2
MKAGQAGHLPRRQKKFSGAHSPPSPHSLLLRNNLDPSLGQQAQWASPPPTGSLQCSDTIAVSKKHWGLLTQSASLPLPTSSRESSDPPWSRVFNTFCACASCNGEICNPRVRISGIEITAVTDFTEF